MGGTLRCAQAGYRRAIGGWFAFLVMFQASLAWGQAVGDIIRVDEHWELKLIQPDGDLLAPQFHTVISPFGHLDSFYAQFTWNYRELPDFAPGGFQVQGWANDDVSVLKSFELPEFSNTAETVTWTQAMGTTWWQTAFAILNADSSTWGAFGGFSTGLTGFPGLANLNEYSPNTSVANSWITYGANRVVHLRIVRVDYVTSEGYMFSDMTSREVALPQAPEED